MKAFINIPKRRGSCNTTRNGALLDAVKASTVRGLPNAWKLEADGSAVDCMVAAKQLRERLELSILELRDHPHSSFAELEARGVFGGLDVLDRRGFWRVEYNGQVCIPRITV